MKTRSFAAAVIAVGTIATVVLIASPLTPEQTLDRRTIGELDFSPDGSKLAFTVTEPVKGASRARSVWLLDVATGRLRRLTFSAKSDASPRWAPDGSSIAFTSDRDGAAQLYRLSASGGEAEKLTDRKERVESFRWAPDSSRIALLMSEAKTDERQKRERDLDDSRSVDKDDRHPRVWIVDLATKELRQITSGHWKIDQVEWLPDGRRLVAAGTDRPEVDQWIDRIVTIDVERPTEAAPAEIAAPRGPFASLAVSPDGASVAYVGARVDGPEPHDLYVQPISGGKAANLSAKLDRPIGQPRWRDSQTITALMQRGFRSTIAALGRNGEPRVLEDLDTNPITFAEARDGTIAFVGDSATRAPELYIKTPGGRPRAVSAFNTQWSSIALTAPEFIKYKSFDGGEIEAALLLPGGPDPSTGSGSSRATSRDERAALRTPGNEQPATSNRAFPLIVLVHGGPTGRWSDSFEPWGQLLASRGYAVLYPNVRGSTGYGQAFVELNRGDWGGGDFKDVMAAVDAMIARGVADPNRLGIGGWSYGGYMAAWAVTQTTRFKAAVSGAPVIDLASEFGTENGSAYDEWFYGTPYEKLDGFIKSSPITYVKNVRTPTLLLQGEDDLTDPLGQSQQFYRGLKRYHVDTDLIVYPREPHGFREEKHLLDRMHRLLAWFDKYLKANPAASAQ